MRDIFQRSCFTINTSAFDWFYVDLCYRVKNYVNINFNVVCVYLCWVKCNCVTIFCVVHRKNIILNYIEKEKLLSFCSACARMQLFFEILHPISHFTLRTQCKKSLDQRTPNTKFHGIELHIWIGWKISFSLNLFCIVSLCQSVEKLRKVKAIKCYFMQLTAAKKKCLCALQFLSSSTLRVEWHKFN